MTKQEIKNFIMEGINKGYSHAIIYCDHWDYIDYCRYVEEDKDVNDVIDSIKSSGSPGMYSIEEVYNYNLDIVKQLNEEKAYHIEPIKRKEKGKIKEALDYAIRMHEGQYRKDGLPYITHPIKVAQYVSKFKESSNIDTLIMAALLHDTIEDTKATYYDIVNKFGPSVAALVLELTTDEDLKKEIGKTKYLEIKMKNMSGWALVIKLCDRLANICDLENVEEAFRIKYIKETIEILNYVTENRNLSKTHIKIMKYILFHIKQLNFEYPLENNNVSEKIPSIENRIKILNSKSMQ